MKQDEKRDENDVAPPRAGAARDEIRALFVEHNSQLLRFLRTRGTSEQEARDVAQEAYVRLLALQDKGTVSFLRAYLYKIASNLITDRSRRHAVRETAHADPVFQVAEATEISPETILADREQLDIVETALAELPEKIKMTFILHRLDGLRVIEVAERLGISERSARSYILTAMVHLKRRLGTKQEEGRADAY